MLHNHMIIVFLVISIGRLGAAADPNCISMNCGGGAAPATGKWHRDAAPEGSSTTSTAKGDHINQFSFSFQLSPGWDTTGVGVYVDNSTALERVHYQHIKWGPVSAGDDIAAMFGMWAEPTAKENTEMATNKTWSVSIDVGFNYLLRLHLCEAGLDMDFELLINNMVFLTSADMLQNRGNRNLLWHRNYVVMVEGLKQEGKRDISISLHSRHEFLDRHGPLEGFEVFKLSNHDRALASPVQDSPSQTLLHSLRALLYNPYGHPMSLLSYTILIHMCAILVVFYLESNAFGLMGLLPNTKEDNKPSSMAKRLAEILGICEYGGVDKGFVDYGREIVAIKPLKIDFKQGEHEFRTVIETLWGLRHANLLSLIGCCRKQQEMVLVNEYIPSAKMAYHLYKPARKSNDVCLQSWKQRLQICIEVSQALLEYLHSGPMIVHRDLKPSNILLDENFVAKLGDFGLAESRSFRNSQSQDTTDLIGTCGYITPNFFTTGELTKGSDVYSFGMVLLETLCGRAAMKPRSEEDNCNDDCDTSEKENMNLVAPNEKINADNYVSWMESTDSSTGSQQPKMPPGFRFHPSDSELITYYLKKKITSAHLHVDHYNCEPWDLPETAATFREKEWYFFSMRDRKHLNRARPNWAATSRYWKTRGVHKKVMNSSESMQGFQEWLSYHAKASDFGLAELKAVTRNFRSDSVLGEGGFAKVYKGWLQDDRPTSKPAITAVKKLNSESMQGFLEWQSEVKSYDLEDTELLLAYEFMAKGSLENNLFGRGASVQPLPCDTRLKILIGAARGLAFLHASDKKVVYRDLKASNILLDGSYHAKLSEFGQGPSDSYSHLSTHGYAAPEYIATATGQLDAMSIVSSLGMVVLKMLTRMRASNTIRPSGSGHYDLGDWTKLRLSDLKHIDVRLEEEDIAELALESEPKNRPSKQETVHTQETFHLCSAVSRSCPPMLFVY